jgi:flagellar hook-associated protein 2
METPSATATSIVQTLGGGSGIDMAALATNLANAQFALRTERLTAKSEVLERQISAASSLKNTLSLFASALGDRVRTGDLASKATVGNGSVAKASSPIGTLGSGSYSLEVTALAQAQTVASPAYAAGTTPVGAGALTLRFGAATAAGFTEDATRTAVDITIPSGATLADVAVAINGSGAGVRAYVANTANGAQLVLKGADGAQNGFVLDATETAGDEGLANLAWNPSAGGDPARLLAQSRDAAFLLDGLPMTSSSNTTAQIAPGLQLQLTATNTGNPTTIAFEQPTAMISTAMGDIVGALNEIVSALNAATDPLTGDLARDPGARALKRALSQLGGTMVMPNAAEGAPRTLSDLGLALERDGTFRLDSTRLQATLERDPAGVAAMFTTGLYGVYSTIDKVARNAARTGDPGTIGGSISRYQSLSAKVAADSADLAERQEALRAQMVARFARTDARVGTSRSTLSFLQGQIDAWNAQRN